MPFSPGAFEVNSPSWDDGSRKTRWVLLKDRNRPDGAGSIRYSEKDDYWGYPESTVFIQQFAIDTLGGSSGEILWETRLLMNKKIAVDDLGAAMDGWYGFSYKWRADQRDADLVDMLRGKKDSIRIWPDGQGAAKTSYMKKWRIPNIFDCTHCHLGFAQAAGRQGRSVLGFFTAQLNRPLPDPAGTNGVELDYDYQDMKPRMEFRHHWVGYPRGLDTIPPEFYPVNDPVNNTHSDSARIIPALVVPGYPEKSLLLFRQAARSTQPGSYDLIVD